MQPYQNMLLIDEGGPLARRLEMQKERRGKANRLADQIVPLDSQAEMDRMQGSDISAEMPSSAMMSAGVMGDDAAAGTGEPLVKMPEEPAAEQPAAAPAKPAAPVQTTATGSPAKQEPAAQEPDAPEGNPQVSRLFNRAQELIELSLKQPTATATGIAMSAGSRITEVAQGLRDWTVEQFNMGLSERAAALAERVYEDARPLRELGSPEGRSEQRERALQSVVMGQMEVSEYVSIVSELHQTGRTAVQSLAGETAAGQTKDGQTVGTPTAITQEELEQVEQNARLQGFGALAINMANMAQSPGLSPQDKARLLQGGIYNFVDQLDKAGMMDNPRDAMQFVQERLSSSIMTGFLDGQLMRNAERLKAMPPEERAAALQEIRNTAIMQGQDFTDNLSAEINYLYPFRKLYRTAAMGVREFLYGMNPLNVDGPAPSEPQGMDEAMSRIQEGRTGGTTIDSNDTLPSTKAPAKKKSKNPRAAAVNSMNKKEEK